MQYSFSALSVAKHEENKPKKTRLSYTKLPCRLCFFFFFFFLSKAYRFNLHLFALGKQEDAIQREAVSFYCAACDYFKLIRTS